MTREIDSAGRFGFVYSLAVAGPWLVIADARLDPHVVVVDRQSGVAVNRVGRHGNGRDEFTRPGCLRSERSNPLQLWTFDDQTGRLAEVRIEAAGRLTVVRDRRLRAEPGQLYCVYSTRRGMVAHGSFEGGPLVAVDTAGNKGAPVISRPPFTRHATLNDSRFALSPSGVRAAVAYRHTSRLDLVETQRGWYRTVRGPRPVTALYAVADRRGRERVFFADSSRVAYPAVAATERYIYALFSGCTWFCGIYGTQIQVYDWDGTLVRDFAIDQRALDVTVSPDDRVLYAVYSDGTRQRVGQWELASLRLQRPARPQAGGNGSAR